MRLIDTHAHLQFSAYDADRAEVIGRALEAGIGVVNVGTHVDSSRAAADLAETHRDGVWATVGFHPGHAHRSRHDAWEDAEPVGKAFAADEIKELAMRPKVAAIGECGLDYHRLGETDDAELAKEKQKEIFISHIELAQELKKPLVIHCREAFSDLVKILTSNSRLLTAEPSGIIHFFSGTVEDAEKLMDLGFYLGFGGVVTFAKSYEALVRAVPLDRIVLETDAPYVAPVPYRGKRNEPLYIEAVASKIAEWRGISFDELAFATTANAKKVYRIM